MRRIFSSQTLCAYHGAPLFRRGSPFLRLLIGSKAGEVIEFIVVSHDAPPRVRMNLGNSRQWRF